jgi:hypothetical protein
MKPFLPKKFEMVAFGFLLSAFMSFLITGVATFLTIGMSAAFVAKWMAAWLPSWAVAFPTVLVVAPFVRRLLKLVVKPA